MHLKLIFLLYVWILLQQLIKGDSEWIRRMHRANASEHARYFGIVLNDGNFSYVAASNEIVVVDRQLGTFSSISIRTLEGIKTCRRFHPTELCVNDINVMQKVNSTVLLACGTNLFSPKCFYVYTKTRNFTSIEAVVRKYLPTNPSVSVPAVLTNGETNPQIYNALCNINSCSMNRFLNTSSDLSLLDATVFNSPTFLNIYTADNHGKNIYLFYRERSNIFQDDRFTRTGQSNDYGLVARVCHSDIGGIQQYTNNFMTFMRARLICPYSKSPGSKSENVLYYNNLRSTYKVGNVVFALFSLPNSWNFKANAVCAFDINTIEAHINGSAFQNGITKYYDPSETDLAATFGTNSPFLPGQCPGTNYTTKNVNAAFVTFLRSHSIVAKAVPPIGDVPLYVSEYENYDFLLVNYVGDQEVLYLFTGKGYVKKVLIAPSAKLLTEYQLSIGNEVIQTVSLTNQSIIVVTNRTIYELEPSLCSNYNNCDSCSADPHCSWEMNANQLYNCVTSPGGHYTAEICSPEPSSPTDVTSQRNDLSINIDWQPGSDGVPTTGYLLDISPNASEDSVFPKVLSSNFLQFPKSTLNAGVKYVVSIRAINNNSYSEEATFYEFTTEMNKPVLEVQDVDHTSATLVWNQVQSAVNYNLSIYNYPADSLIRNYIIIRLSNSADEAQMFPVNNLLSAQQYKVYLTAISADQVVSSPSIRWINTTLPTTAGITSSIASTTQAVTTTISKTASVNITASFTSPSLLNSLPSSSNIRTISSTHPVTSTLTSSIHHSITNSSTKIPLISTIYAGVSTKNNQEEVTKKANTPLRSSQQDMCTLPGQNPMDLLFLALFVIALILLIPSLAIFLHNGFSIGFTTRTISINTNGEKGREFERKCFCFWRPIKGLRGRLEA